MPEFQTFFTPARLDEFWYYVKWFLFFGAPLIMIMVASEAVLMLITVIRKSFANTNQVGKQEKDDDYEIRHY